MQMFPFGSDKDESGVNPSEKQMMVDVLDIKAGKRKEMFGDIERRH